MADRISLEAPAESDTDDRFSDLYSSLTLVLLQLLEHLLGPLQHRLRREVEVAVLGAVWEGGLEVHEDVGGRGEGAAVAVAGEQAEEVPHLEFLGGGGVGDTRPTQRVVKKQCKIKDYDLCS